MNRAQCDEGRVAIVSGAGGGIGRGVAICLARHGVACILQVRREETGRAVLREIEEMGGRGAVLTGDIAEQITAGRAVALAEEVFGRLDIVVHNATHGDSTQVLSLESAGDEHWQALMGVSLDGSLHLAQAAFPLLRVAPEARFVVLVAAAAMHGGARNAVYSSVKGAQRGFVKALAREWGPHEITVNGVAPVSVTAGAEEHFRLNPELFEPLIKTIPLARMGSPERDVGAAICALCSPDFRYVTGQTICVDGGAYGAL